MSKEYWITDGNHLSKDLKIAAHRVQTVRANVVKVVREVKEDGKMIGIVTMETVALTARERHRIAHVRPMNYRGM